MKASKLRQDNRDAVQAMRVIRNQGLQGWMPIYAEETADSLVSGVRI